MEVAFHLNTTDYDGDELNFTLMLDDLMSNEFKTLAPFYGIPSAGEPYDVSSVLTLLSPANSILANALVDNKDDPSKDTLFSKLSKVTITVP